MGYRKKSDGTWEQPVEAEARLKRRAVRNFVAATVLGTTVAGGAALGFGLSLTNNGDQDKAVGGLLLMVFSAAVGAVGAIPLAKNISRTERSLDAVQKDIRDGVEVIDKGVAIRPEDKVFLGLA